MEFHEFMRCGHVKRWHVINTTRQQTVAEHHYMVALIALELLKRTGMPMDTSSTFQLVMTALFHDMPEIRYGDMPTPGKKFIKDRFGEDAFDKMDATLMPVTPYIGGTLDPSWESMVKLADKIEAAYWLSENGSGTHAKKVAELLLEQVGDMVAGYLQDATRPYDWYGPVNHVLMSLGMPYLNRGTRSNPL